MAKDQERDLVSPFLDVRQGKNSGLKNSHIKENYFFVAKLQQMSAFFENLFWKKTPELGMRKEQNTCVIKLQCNTNNALYIFLSFELAKVKGRWEY